MTLPDDDPLLAGYRRFRDTSWSRDAPRYRSMARRGQKPRIAVVACSDARVDPEVVFDAEPGVLFVIRNVAGLVPVFAPDGGCHGTSAALEYAVKVLKVDRIVVLGHHDCDGVHAMIHGPLRQAREFLGPWMDIAEPVMWPIRASSPEVTMEAALELEVVKLSVRNLRTFPWIAEAERAGRLSLSAWIFDIATGGLVQIDADGD